ncbi:ABC transporter permease [Plesiomonas shigelloides]|uniref:ABC transporter permease n=1 Tax=Plesiomonas shigelloides TaxID=703 RepID=UPI0012614290|nr:ABC transporter permease [Plesiomonas shigelloides]KAB7681574.1 FtsX-like permease family protein [Plesiomonas shigelloides]
MGQLTGRLWRIAALNLYRNRRRTVLSVCIIAIAVFALTSAGGFGLYTYDSLRESTARDVGHLTISQQGYFAREEETPLANGLHFTPQLNRLLSTNPAIVGIGPRIELTGLISNGAKSTIFMGLGVLPQEFTLKGEFLDLRSGHTITEPTKVNSGDAAGQGDDPQVMLGVDLARNLNVRVGDSVTLLSTTADGALNALDFRVAGIYSSGVPEVDERQLYLHLNAAQELLASDKVSTLSLYLHNTAATEAVAPWVKQQLTDLGLAQSLEVTPWQKLAFFYQKVKDLYDRLFGVMGGVMSLVVFVALFNTLTMSVTERTREIGTLSALGAYPLDIIGGFIREAVWLAVLGSLLGTLLTGVTSLTLQWADVQMPAPPGRSAGYPLHIYFSWQLALLCAAGVMVICVLAAWLSARKGVRKPITEALAYV